MRVGNRLAAAALITASSIAAAADDARLNERLKQRFEGDRTGACVVAAVVDGDTVARGRYCARAGDPPGDRVAFEIGSVTKTMLGFLVADLIEERGWTLDDPIAKRLPEGSRVPRFGNDGEILVRHLVTHTAGLPPLPPNMALKDARDPYAELSETALLTGLSATALSSAPGTRAAYSNFGGMVLSLAVAEAYGTSIEDALRARLFDPLEMRQAAVRRRDGVAWAQGHAMNGADVPAWTIGAKLAGVGMVRASLDDMVKYLRAEMGASDTPLERRLKRTQQPVMHGHGILWLVVPFEGRTLVAHEGGTGGFSSFIGFDPATCKGVVMLADTAMSDLGGLGDAALPLISAVPMGRPRRTVPAPAALLKEMPGEYVLAARNLRLKIWADEGRLKVQAAGQEAHALEFDSRGDFYPRTASFVVRPVVVDGHVERIVLRQGGGVLEALRAGDRKLIPTAINPAWQDYAGEYEIAPNFSLRVFEEEGKLKVQGTGQVSIVAELTQPDRIEIKSVGAVIDFQRDERNRVVSATLSQRGQVLKGARRAER